MKTFDVFDAAHDGKLESANVTLDDLDAIYECDDEWPNDRKALDALEVGEFHTDSDQYKYLRTT